MKIGWVLLVALLSVPMYGQKLLSSDTISCRVDGRVDTIITKTTWGHPLAINYEEDEFYKHSPYWKRYRVLHVLGWTSVGIGVPMVCCAALYGVLNHDMGGENLGTAGGIVLAAGLGLAVASVPLFICAHHNKKKALALSIGTQGMAVPSLDGGGMHYQPALAVRVCF